MANITGVQDPIILANLSAQTDVGVGTTSVQGSPSGVITTDSMQGPAPAPLTVALLTVIPTNDAGATPGGAVPADGDLTAQAESLLVALAASENDAGAAVAITGLEAALRLPEGPAREQVLQSWVQLSAKVAERLGGSSDAPVQNAAVPTQEGPPSPTRSARTARWVTWTDADAPSTPSAAANSPPAGDQGASTATSSAVTTWTIGADGSVQQPVVTTPLSQASPDAIQPPPGYSYVNGVFYRLNPIAGDPSNILTVSQAAYAFGAENPEQYLPAATPAAPPTPTYGMDDQGNIGPVTLAAYQGSAAQATVSGAMWALQQTTAAFPNSQVTTWVIGPDGKPKLAQDVIAPPPPTPTPSTMWAIGPDNTIGPPIRG